MLKRLSRSERGFTLTELLVVIAIIGLLGAIAIPSALNQRTRVAESTMKSDLLSTAANLDTLLASWRGVPPAEVTITTTGENWSAVPAGLPTATTGRVSGGGNSVSGTIWTDGSYCIRATNTGSTGASYIYRSDTKSVVSGTCPTTALGGTSSTPASSALNLPSTPTNVVATSTTDNTVTVNWNAVSGASSYTVSLVGRTSREVVTTSTTFTDVAPGTVTVIVYAKNSNGSGPGASATVAVNGVDQYALSERLNTYTYVVADQTAKNAIVTTGLPAGSTVWVADTAWVESWTGTAWIISSGTMPYGEASRTSNLSVAHNTDVPFTSDGTVTPIGMTYNASNGAFTVTRAGRYEISFGVYFAGVAGATGVREAKIEKNLSSATLLLRARLAPASGIDTYLAATRTVTLAAGDSIRLVVYQSQGTTQSLVASSTTPGYLSINYVGP